MSFDALNVSERGYSHVKKDIPCEDYGIKFKDDNCQIFVLGDGHGDKNCPRSAIGSKLICEIAKDELEQFDMAIRESEWIDSLFDAKKSEELIRQLITSIFGKWSCAVNEDFEKNPLTEKEFEEATKYADRYRNGERIEHVYGTTFIAGLLTEKYLLLLQQGDGRCVVFDSEGNVSQPIPWDDRCFANVTTSVCDSDAVMSCRYHVIDLAEQPIIACFAGSDGVEDSYASMDKMHMFYRNLLKYAYDNGISELEKYLLQILPEFSERGSGDDVTICGVINTEAVAAIIDKMSKDNEIVSWKEEVATADEHIESMSAKLVYYKEKHDRILSEYSEIEKRYNELEIEYQELQADIGNSTEDDFDGENEDGEAVGFISKIKNKILSSHSIACISERLEVVKQELTIVEKELKDIAEKKEEFEKEYFDYQKRYDYYIQLKAEAEEKLNQCNL